MFNQNNKIINLLKDSLMCVSLILLFSCNTGLNNPANGNPDSQNQSPFTQPIIDTSSDSTATESIPEDSNPSAGINFSAEYNIYINLTDGTASDDNVNFSEITTSKLKLLNKTANINFTTDENDLSTGLIKLDITEVTDAVAVYLNGTLTTGGIKIQTNGSDQTGIYLNNVSITSSNYPCIEITKGSPSSIFLSGNNQLTDGRNYGTGYGEYYTNDTTLSGTTFDDEEDYIFCDSGNIINEGSDSKGTIYCKGSLAVCGTGTLNLSQHYKHCIVSKKFLNIYNGNLILTSNGKSGLYADCGIKVFDGNISFTGTGAVSTTESRKTHAFNVDDDTYIDAFVKIAGGIINIDSYNGKGINAPVVEISGGKIDIITTGVTNFTKDNNKTGSYYDADGVLQSNVSITFAAEGIEGADSVIISAGEITVNAIDDGINVSNKGGTFKLTGGSVYSYSQNGDGIDSNGNIYITDGILITCAPTGSENGLDSASENVQMGGKTGGFGNSGISNGYVTEISGGLIAAISGNSNKATLNGTYSITISSSDSLSGKTIAIKNSQSELVYVLTCPEIINLSASRAFNNSNNANFKNLFLVSPVFKSETYTVYTNVQVDDNSGTNFNGLYNELPSVIDYGTTSITSKASN